ncbi:hypothetical protein [Sulfurimonas paralvinellae]|uniref:DUF302 domain-containing protein n=1 Tax=Sulfurimonas paralvinellae TaxID=317658 RepID=A0A7M1B9U5_9BACT|nr:hypothetical protein [Sulfurimonas paralvinellae]QOP46411.1 hypothetical protein FM071_08955 [Sulfurimonas paralvinellae]
MKKILLSGLLATLLGSTLMAENISSYEYAQYKEKNDVKSILRDNNLKIVGEYDAMQNPNYHVIAYTNDTLMADASKDDDDAFAAVQKVMINKADKQLVFTNPEYFLHAFLEDDYKADDAKSLNATLAKAFGKLTPSKDGLDADDIEGYHFMMGMPYYEDMIEVAKGKDLAQKLQTNAGENIVFKIDMPEATLYGVAMPSEKGEKYYVSEIKGQKNAAFLPYMVLIEKDSDGEQEAKILHPKYYLAISYPNLSMGEFMGISGTPGDIEEYFTALFK